MKLNKKVATVECETRIQSKKTTAVIEVDGCFRQTAFRPFYCCLRTLFAAAGMLTLQSYKRKGSENGDCEREGAREKPPTQREWNLTFPKCRRCKKQHGLIKTFPIPKFQIKNLS